jgi:hypothetical protein
MSKTELMETIPPPTCTSTDYEGTTDRPFKKRRRVEESQHDRGRPHRNSERRRQVSWNDDRNVIHLQQDPSKVFPTEYKESDVWYSVSLNEKVNWN